MIGVSINIYGGTPVRSKFTKNVWKFVYSLSWAKFHFLPKLTFTEFCLYLILMYLSSASGLSVLDGVIRQFCN